tara:strand:- start:156 stop:323 length:168 start_codon:yes stop_codon:yes gene_type:complete
MSKELDVKIYLALNKAEYQIRRSAYLSTGEPIQKKIYEALELIKEVKKEIEDKLQ